MAVVGISSSLLSKKIKTEDVIPAEYLSKAPRWNKTSTRRGDKMQRNTLNGNNMKKRFFREKNKVCLKVLWSFWVADKDKEGKDALLKE